MKWSRASSITGQPSGGDSDCSSADGATILAAAGDYSGDSACYLTSDGDAIVDFFEACVSSLRSHDQSPQRYSRQFIDARDRFMNAGVCGLMGTATTGQDWVQYGVRTSVGSPVPSGFYQVLVALVHHLLETGSISNFFFMHKSPGLRLRFQAPDERAACILDRTLDRALGGWADKRVIESFERGFYEPETALFGGPASMQYVHALFTLDSMIWLDYYSRQRQDSVAGEMPRWIISLAIIAAVLDGLEIQEWEDLGVWQHILSRAKRGNIANVRSLTRYEDFASTLGTLWEQRDAIATAADSDTGKILQEYRTLLTEASSRWRANYFQQGIRTVSVRAACAFYVVFLWNRAALPLNEQAVIAEVLANRMDRP